MLQDCAPILDLDEQVVEVEFLPMGADVLLVVSPKISGAMTKTMIEHSIHNFIHASLEFVIGVGEVGGEFEATQFSMKLHVTLVVISIELLTAFDNG